MNLMRLVLHHARTQPDAPAMEEAAGRVVSYRELGDVASRTAGHLRGLGLNASDRVGLCLRDHWEHMALFVAIGLAGLTIVPMDWRAREPEKRRMATALALRLVVIEADDPVDLPCPVVRLDATWRRDVGRIAPLHDPPDDGSAPLVVAATSGTTGPPRFSVCTHAAMFMRASIVVEAVPRGDVVRCLSSSPLYFAGGHVRCLTHLLWGDCVVMHPALFTPEEYAAATRRHAITLGIAVPLTVRQLLALAAGRPFLLPESMALLASGAPLDGEEKREAARTLTPRFHEAYGNSMIGNISVLRPGDLARHADSVGRPHPLTEIAAVDDAQRPVPPNGVGRLRVRGPGLGRPLALPDDADASRAESLCDGWYYPGEIGAIDEEGFVYIKGRTAEVIMRGGAKIDPAEIETVLRPHASVAEAAVIGERAPGKDDAVVAFVVARRRVETGELLATCRARLTAYKVPREIRIVDALPRNTAGKIAKGELAKLLDRDGG